MFNKKMLAASMLVAMTTGGLMSQASASVPVGIAANDTAQVLLAPLFYTRGGYTTDITVTNTRTDAAVKAKVVFRSHVDSKEILDFIIYLTPGDVWRGQVVMGADGEGHITSSDDSMRNATDDGWANAVPVDQPFFAHRLTDADDTTQYGHFEIIGTYTAQGTYPEGLVQQQMSKDILRDIFIGADATPPTNAHNADYLNCGPAALIANAPGEVSSISPCAMQLMGEVRIGNATDPNRASYRMTALGTNTPAATNDEVAAEQAGYVVTNPDFNTDLSDESLLGFGFGQTNFAVGEECDGDNILCIEHALAAEQTSHEYESDADQITNTLMTFPTRYRHDEADPCATGAPGPFSPPFQPAGEMQYSFTSLDNSENAFEAPPPGGNPFSGNPAGPAPTVDSFPNEVNYHSPIDYFSTSGWAYYQWLPRTGCEYVGSPVIGLSYKLMPGTTATQTMFLPASNNVFVD